MIAGRRVLAVIPARGGSKGLARKNVLDLGGRPLIAWSIEAARQSRYIDRCIVSTDDAEIADVATAAGGDLPFRRPAALARDESTTLEVALHALDQLPGYAILVILQPTSPLRRASDIDHTLERLSEAHANSAVTVVEPAKSPYWSYTIDEDGRLHHLIDPALAGKRRQELPAAYVLNGAVYAADAHWLRGHGSFVGPDSVACVMPASRSLDIDTAFDLKLAGFYLQETP